jgi:hypothetical protein
MPTTVKATTNILLDTSGTREPTQLYGQVYRFTEEGGANVTRQVNAGQKEDIVVVPDTDIQSSVKFVHISANGEVADLQASRVALSVRKYGTPKSATSSGDVISTFNPDPTVVFGAVTSNEVMGDKSLENPISIKGGEVGVIMAKDSNGAVTDYADNNALPLTLHVQNKGVKPVIVNVKSIYDPSPADHKGTA